MIISILGNKSLHAVEDFLRKHADTSMFLLSNMSRAGLDYSEKEFSGQYWGAWDGNKLCGVLAHYWNCNVVIQAPDMNVLNALVDCFASAKTREVRGILGANKQALNVIEILNFKEDEFLINKYEGLYRLDLDKMIMPPVENCTLVSPASIDADLLFDWMKAYNIEALGAEDNDSTSQRIRKDTFAQWAIENRRILMKDGIPVALAGCNAKAGDMVQIGPVWTPPQYRGRGYARCVTAMLLEQEKQIGARRAILFTDTPAAIKAYQAIGFIKVDDFRLALLK